MNATVNIGLAIGDGTRKLAPSAALAALRLAGVQVLSSAVLASDTEPTLVADIFPALSAERAHLIADALEQEAIAQRIDGVGELHGPAAHLWRPFNPAYFLDLSQDAARAA